MNAQGFFAPCTTIAFMLGDAVADDEALDVRMLDLAGNGEDTLFRHGRGSLAALGMTLEQLPFFHRHAALAHANERAVFPAHDGSTLAIDHEKRVTITGANEPTTSSCPSREQTTPG